MQVTSQTATPHMDKQMLIIVCSIRNWQTDSTCTAVCPGNAGTVITTRSSYRSSKYFRRQGTGRSTGRGGVVPPIRQRDYPPIAGEPGCRVCILIQTIDSPSNCIELTASCLTLYSTWIQLIELDHRRHEECAVCLYKPRVQQRRSHSVQFNM